MAKKKNEVNEGPRYVLLPFVGVHDFRTGKNYNHKNITDEVAAYLLENYPTYRDRILTVEEYEELGRPSFSGYQKILARGKYNAEIEEDEGGEEAEEIEEIEEPESETPPEDDPEPEKK